MALGKGADVLADSLAALASLAGYAVVAVAVTDDWASVRSRLVPLLGLGDPFRTQTAERRLDETRRQLESASDEEIAHLRADLAAQWTTRLADLLADNPGVEPALTSLVQELNVTLTDAAIRAAGHSVSAGRDIDIAASAGGIAVGVIHGNISVVHQHVHLGRRVAGSPVSLSPRPALLVGRESIFADLDARLSAADPPRVRIAVLSGLGGVGKTSIALEYAHMHLAEVGVAWQLAAEDPAVLAAGMAELAAQLGVRDAPDVRDPVASVHAALAAWPFEWLLVFDNAPDAASLRPFVPPAGRGRVLITSQSSRWPAGQATDVPVLDTESAAGLLMLRTGDPDRQAAIELGQELGGLPLALEQAAAYILDTGSTLARYHALFQEHRAEMLDRGAPSDHDKTVSTTWTVAFARLDQDEPAAVGLMRLLACCAPEPVPLGWLLKRRNGRSTQLQSDRGPTLARLENDPLAVGDAIAALRRYSLVMPAADDMVLVHRLVQAVTLAQMPLELAASWRRDVAALIEAAIPADTSPPAAWPICAVLLPHARIALAEASAGMARMADYLGASGSYAAARDLWRRVAQARERSLGPEHPDTLAARHELALFTGDAGEPEIARKLFAALAPACERVLGPEHADTLNARCNLALFTGQMGDAVSARDIYAAIVPIRERAFGSDHPDTLTDRGNLATWTGMAGGKAAARDLLAELVPIRERVQGAEHPRTLNTRHELATWTGRAGDPAAARDQFAELLPIRERVQGADHPETLFARFNRAHWTGEAGDPVAARDQFAELIPIFERVQGAEHPQTVRTKQELTRWTDEADRQHPYPAENQAEL